MIRPTEHPSLNATTAPRRQRSGHLIVELAFLLPIVFLLFAGLVEFSRAAMLKHTVDTAAYEGARAAIVVGATASDATTAAEDLLNSTHLNSWTITVAPTVISEGTPTVTVSVDIPFASNSWIAPFFMNGSQVSSSVTLLTERPAQIQLTGISSL